MSDITIVDSYALLLYTATQGVLGLCDIQNRYCITVISMYAQQHSTLLTALMHCHTTGSLCKVNACVPISVAGNSTALFQLRLAGDLACVEWVVSCCD